ncbi:hypothetical protein P3S68_030544 [Capsicum galapagoense]
MPPATTTTTTTAVTAAGEPSESSHHQHQRNAINPVLPRSSRRPPSRNRWNQQQHQPVTPAPPLFSFTLLPRRSKLRPIDAGKE